MQRVRRPDPILLLPLSPVPTARHTIFQQPFEPWTVSDMLPDISVTVAALNAGLDILTTTQEGPEVVPLTSTTLVSSFSNSLVGF